MTQQFKTIYFPARKGKNRKRRNITVAFGDTENHIYQEIKTLTSLELREIIGHDTCDSLAMAAKKDQRPVSSYCLNQMRKVIREDASTTYITQREQNELSTDWLQATFRGGRQEPLHEWYPYLEGYSPQFVRNVINHFAPNTCAVFDPFAGVGTTPLTSAQMDVKSFYCEVNPLLQYLIETKISVLTTEKEKRREIASELSAISNNFLHLLNERESDFELHCAYFNTFKNSKFFDDKVFDQVLRARSLIDWLKCEKPFVSTLVEWAVISSLIPSSKLIRRGDLRFKNKEELLKHRIDFSGNVRQKLDLMIKDLSRIESISDTPECLCYNAQDIDKVPAIDIDCVVTSPPYLNGTNYFRNTKIELWFIRTLRSNNDLRAFRDEAITAGINDVSQSPSISFQTKEIESIVRELEHNAYDQRIPQMVACYFNDMHKVFKGLSKHLTRNARIVIDIGDSRYNDVHVPTDVLLVGILQEMGYQLTHETILRRRCSRNGKPLRQVLLAFNKSRTSVVRESSKNEYQTWLRTWQTFKKQLPHQEQPYAKRNWGHPLHSLCSYQGKLKPSLAHFLVKTFVPQNGSLLDPFAGVGTIPFEAALAGKIAWGFDINPAAIRISRAKMGRPQLKDCMQIIKKLKQQIKRDCVNQHDLEGIKSIRFNQPLMDYFHPKTLREILIARRFFIKTHVTTESEALVFSSLLHILHGNRPYALSRRSHPITPFAPSGPKEYRPLIPRLEDKTTRSLSAGLPDIFQRGTVYDQDVTACWPLEVNNLDAIITSPPFFDSTRFYLANWMRLWFCGWESNDFKVRPLAYIDERQKKNFEVYKPFFRQARERLKPDGVLVLHLGRSRKCNMSEYLKLVARHWFKVADFFEENVEHCESHGITDKGTVTNHQFLVLN